MIKESANQSPEKFWGKQRGNRRERWITPGTWKAVDERK